MAKLLNLPSELIAQIFEYLEDQDVLAARQSSRQVEKASFSHFGKRFFRKTGYMITSPSLDVLKSVSKHEELRKYPQHVWFNPDCFTFYPRPDCWCSEDECASEDDMSEPVASSERSKRLDDQSKAKHSGQCIAYMRCIVDHSELLYGERLAGEFQRIFNELPNLLTVGMRRSESYSPRGWKRLQDAVGQDPRVLGPIPSGPRLNLSGPTQLFIALIKALAVSHVNLARLYTDAIEIDNIKAEVLPAETLSAACSSVNYLEFNAVKASISSRYAVNDPNCHRLQYFSEYGDGLVRLFGAMPQLKEVGLQIFPDRMQTHLLPPSARNPHTWRQSYPYLSLEKLSDNVTLPHLKRVKLEKVTCSSAILQRFLQPCAANLTSLKLRDLRFLSSEDEPKPWRTMFEFLHSHCANLQYVVFYHLMHDRGGISYAEDPPSALPADNESYLIDHLPGSLGGQARFTSYNHIALEETGTEKVKQRLAEAIEQHWHHKPLFSYAMDEELWHTDTSDEEW